MEIRGDRRQTAPARKHAATGEKEGYYRGFHEGFCEGVEQGLEMAFQEKYRKAVEQACRDELAEYVTLQLMDRFGDLPEYVDDVIYAADSTTLIRLGERIFLAASLDDLVPRPARHRVRATDAAPGRAAPQAAKPRVTTAHAAALMEICGDRRQTAPARKHAGTGDEEGYDKGFDEGFDKGVHEGFEQGLDRIFQEKYRKAVEQARRGALAYLVTVQLQSRFGPLPEYAVRAIVAGDSTALFWLGERIFLAESLDDLFSRPARRLTPATAAGTRPRSRAGSKAETRNRTRNRSR